MIYLYVYIRNDREDFVRLYLKEYTKPDKMYQKPISANRILSRSRISLVVSIFIDVSVK